jgi:uncharacterized repeat protein (TIGR01451 family)
MLLIIIHFGCNIKHRLNFTYFINTFCYHSKMFSFNCNLVDTFFVAVKAIILVIFSSIFAYIAFVSDAKAQTATTYSSLIGGDITDNNCGTAAQIFRTINVPSNFVIADVDFGVFLTHTYRSDLRITLTSPAGTTVTVMTWTGNVQSGDNLNDRFDDEAATAIGTHVAGAIDPLTPAPPPYFHSFRPSNPLSVFDGQNALGNWTLVICDAVGTDVGIFTRADLFLTPALSVTKTSSITADTISVSNPKSIPGSTVRYCIVVTNPGPNVANNIVASDILPSTVTYNPGSIRSGATCVSAATVEDDNAIGADEGDPVGASFAANTISIRASTLAATGAINVIFEATIN